MPPSARRVMAEVTVDEVQGEGKIIDHIGAVDLLTAIELAQHAANAGVDALSSVPPLFFKYSEGEIYQYYKTLASVVDLPFIIYTFGMDLATVERLMAIPNIIGLKYTNPNYYEMHRFKKLSGGDINVFNGSDESLLCGLVMGADGGIGSTYNVMPKLFVSLYQEFQTGNIVKAQQLQFKINKVIEVIIEFGVFPGVKELLIMMGFPVGYCTLPLKRFTDDERRQFKKRIEHVLASDDSSNSLREQLNQ